MQPEQPQPTQTAPVPAPQPAPASGPLNPIAQFECWYLPEGRYTIFNYRKSVVVLYPGWMVVYKQSDHSELARIQLGPDTQMKRFLGFVRFAQLHGRKYSVFKPNNQFAMAIWNFALIFVIAIISFIVQIIRFNLPGPNLELQVLILCMQLSMMGMLFVGRPKAKALVEATKRAVGVAS